jgi:hypothetical protein
MARENFNGLQEVAISASTKMISSMATVRFLGQTAVILRVLGAKGSRMELVSCVLTMERSEQVFSKKMC